MKLHSGWKIFIICFFILSITIPSFAAVVGVGVDTGAVGGLDGGSGGTATSSSSNFDLDGFESTTTSEVGEVAGNVLGQAIGVVRIIGFGISIIILTVVASKYMISSAGDRAEIKKNAVPFVIGAIVLFGASGILGIIVDLASNVK